MTPPGQGSGGTHRRPSSRRRAGPCPLCDPRALKWGEPTKTVVAVFCGKARSKYGRPFDVADAMTALLAERSCFSFALRQTRLRCYIYGFACAILASCSVSACNGNELFFYYASTASLLRLWGGVRRCVFELVPDLLVLWGFRSWVNTAQASVAVGFLCSAFW